MEKMRMESVDMIERNVDKIAALFPNCITEALDEGKSTPGKKVYKKVAEQGYMTYDFFLEKLLTAMRRMSLRG